MRELIKADADLNLKNDYERTALMVAIQKGHEAIALALIKAGAYLNFKDTWGDSALKYARSGGHAHIENYLLENGAKEYLLRKKIMKLLPGAAKKAIPIASTVIL